VVFPDLSYDEGVYMRRALHVLAGLGPQESQTYYDHPFFGQLFLSVIFKIIGYPEILHISNDKVSIDMLYTIPRVLMGLLAVIDTLLLYKISEHRYNKNIAFVASILFAVMPLTWLTRRILLEPIQLPFFLSAILFAEYTRDHEVVTQRENWKFNKNILFVLFSGLCLGISIFTKIPIFVTIPLIAYLILTSNNRNWKLLGLWFIPVILIPMMWPVCSTAVGHFKDWQYTILRQMQREGMPFLQRFMQLIKMDPVLLLLATGGFIVALLRRDLFILLWTNPIFLFFLLIEWSWAPYQIFIPLIPAFCISAAVLIFKITERIKYKNIQKSLPWCVTAVLAIFGFVSTSLLLTSNVTSAQFDAAEYAFKYIAGEKRNNNSDDITLVSIPAYSWISRYVYKNDNVLELEDINYHPLKTEKVLFVADAMSKDYNEKLSALYNSSIQLIKFRGPSGTFGIEKYPYTNIKANFEGLYDTEVRIVTR